METTSYFIKTLRDRWSESKFVCVGLDTDYEKIPEHIKIKHAHESIVHPMVDFNKTIIDATKDLVCAYKPNIAFYEQYGSEGMTALLFTINHIKNVAPGVPVILDAKRADIGNTNNGYAKMAFDYFKADAITVLPYMGSEAMKPFLDYADKGIIVLCKTSNPGSVEFQNADVRLPGLNSDENTFTSLFKLVAQKVSDKKLWNYNNNCLLVVGATFPDELKDVRAIVGDMPILVPGIGKQGGDLQKVIENGLDKNGGGLIINSSREVIFASNGEDFGRKAREQVLFMNSEIIKAIRKKVTLSV